jgi:hypothetical protein
MFREDEENRYGDVAEAGDWSDGRNASSGEGSQPVGQAAIGEPHRVGDLEERREGFRIDEEFVRIPSGSGRDDSGFVPAIERPRDAASDARLAFESTQGFHEERLSRCTDAVRTCFARQQDRIEQCVLRRATPMIRTPWTRQVLASRRTGRISTTVAVAPGRRAIRSFPHGSGVTDLLRECQRVRAVVEVRRTRSDEVTRPLSAPFPDQKMSSRAAWRLWSLVDWSVKLRSGAVPSRKGWK